MEFAYQVTNERYVDISESHCACILTERDRDRRHYSHLVLDSILARKAAWALSVCLTTESADYCKLINEWVWLRSRVSLLKAGS